LPEPKTSLLSLRPGLPLEKVVVNHEGPGHLPLPARYSPALHQAIITAVQKGNQPATAAAASGLPRNDFYKWGRDVTDGVAHPYIAKLFEHIEMAHAGAEVTAVESIAESPTNKAENAKWFLEHARQKDWGKREQIIIHNEIDAVVERLLSAFADEPALLDRICKVLTEGK
jgi:hypothetical protein